MKPPRPSPPRRPGRPAADTADQRERLIDAAIGQFSRRGIASASLRDIARESGVTPALVNYYFGSKEKLVSLVIEERVMPALLGVMASLSAAPPDRLVPAFVRAIGELVDRHPWLPGLWVREILVEGGALRELMLDRVAPLLPQMLAQRFAEQQRNGALNADLDPRLLVVSMIGLTMFTHAARPIWSRMFAGPDIDNAQLQRHTLALLERGLEIPHDDH